MKRIFFFRLSVFYLLFFCSCQSESFDDVVRTIKQVNLYWQSNHQELGAAFWDNGIYHTGNMEAYVLTGEPLYLNYSRSWAELNGWMGLCISSDVCWKSDSSEVRDSYPSDLTCFQTFLDLLEVSEKSSRTTQVCQFISERVRLPEPTFRSCADELYRVMPAMVKLYKITRQPSCLRRMYDYFSYTDSLLFDQQVGLYYQNIACVYPKHQTTNFQRDFSARTNGWVMATLVKLLKEHPRDKVFYPCYLARFKRLASILVQTQQPEGYWARSLLDVSYAPGAESSGTSLLTYALFWGINNGLLPYDIYLPVAEKGWSFLRMTALHPDGKVGYVQPLGERFNIGQVVDSNSTSNVGVGVFLLAACERARFLSRKSECLLHH